MLHSGQGPCPTLHPCPSSFVLKPYLVALWALNGVLGSEAGLATCKAATRLERAECAGLTTTKSWILGLSSQHQARTKTGATMPYGDSMGQEATGSGGHS